MLVPKKAIIVDKLYMGPGNGCRHVIRCELIGFTRDLGCEEDRNEMRDAFSEIQAAAFQLFRDGKYTIEPMERHELASSIVERNASDLIDLVFDDDSFVRDIAVRELTQRGLMNRDIYRIGEFGNEQARLVAINMLKSQVDPESTP